MRDIKISDDNAMIKSYNKNLLMKIMYAFGTVYVSCICSVLLAH